ncbi:MAG: transposase [Saprospiraceae bacterium]|nr:transposase [Saprospiraceae bacterium]
MAWRSTWYRSILHTHGQDLSFHPHIHCIVRWRWSD